MKKTTQELQKIIRFSIVGVSNTLIDFGLFTLLAQIWGVNVYFSQFVSFCAGTLNSYTWNRSWTFRSSTKFWSPVLARFLVVNAVMLLVSTGLLWLFYDSFGLHKLVAKVLIAPITILLNFVINRLWIFRT